MATQCNGGYGQTREVNRHSSIFKGVSCLNEKWKWSWQFTINLKRVWFLFFQEHKEGQLTSMPREVCRSFVKIIAEVLGSPPDLELLTIIFNFLLAVHPPTNTYICHNPTNFYFSLHIGRYIIVVRLWLSPFLFFLPTSSTCVDIHWMASVW